MADANTTKAESPELQMQELLSEKNALGKMGDNFQHLERLLSHEIERVQNGGKAIGKEDKRFVDVIKNKPIRVTTKVLVPVRDHPKFNFVGKLLGPKGNSLKRLQEETMTRMAILGKGSMRDKQKEEELRASNDPKYLHLHDDLHVEVSTFAPPAEAHARIAYALAEVRRFLIPDYNDEIRQEQMREMQMLSNTTVNSTTTTTTISTSQTNLNNNNGNINNNSSNSSTTTVASNGEASPQAASPPKITAPPPGTSLVPHPALRGLAPRAGLILTAGRGGPVIPNSAAVRGRSQPCNMPQVVGVHPTKRNVLSILSKARLSLQGQDDQPPSFDIQNGYNVASYPTVYEGYVDLTTTGDNYEEQFMSVDTDRGETKTAKDALKSNSVLNERGRYRHDPYGRVTN